MIQLQIYDDFVASDMQYLYARGIYESEYAALRNIVF